MKSVIKFRLKQDDFLPAFGGYKAGSVKNDHGEIYLNVFAFMVFLNNKKLNRKELPYFVAEVLMHEIMHGLEDWAKAKFSHRKINVLFKKYDKLKKEPR